MNFVDNLHKWTSRMDLVSVQLL